MYIANVRIFLIFTDTKTGYLTKQFLSLMLIKAIEKEDLLIEEGKPYLLLTLLFLIKFFFLVFS